MVATGCGGGGSGGSGRSEDTWTLMVYLDGDNNLEEQALADFNEMEAALAHDGVQIVALFDRSSSYTTACGNWTDTRLYEVSHDTNPSAFSSRRLEDPDGLGITLNEPVELNMGSGETLKKFVAFCKKAYPADRTALILWDHGSGWLPPKHDGQSPISRAVAYDEESKSDALSMKEIAWALNGEKVDLLGFDACLMADMEVAWEVKDVADFMVASQALEPGSGWNYTEFLNRFNGLPAESKGPVGLGTSIAETYLAEAEQDRALTLSLFDLTKIEPLRDAVDALSTEIQNCGDGMERVTRARIGVLDFNDKIAVDLRHFAELLGGDSKLLPRIDDALKDFVRVNVVNASKKSCGVSIYFPVFGSDGMVYDRYKAENLSFLRASTWDEGLAEYNAKCLKIYLKTLPGHKGLDTTLSVYTNNGGFTAFYAGNDDIDSNAGNRFSKLHIPVVRGETYWVLISRVGTWSSKQSAYWIYAGETELSGSQGSVSSDSEMDNHAKNARPLSLGNKEGHLLPKDDVDWVKITIP